MSDLRFETLAPGDYDRAKAVLNKAKHPGFVGRELFFRCATTGVVCVAMLGEQDVGVALVAKDKLQALSVITSAQGHGVGGALMRRLRPRWVSAIGEKVAWFTKIGYVAYGAPRVGQNGKHATQLMERTDALAESKDGVSVSAALPVSASAPEPEAEPPPTFVELMDETPMESAKAQLVILDSMMAKALIAEKFESALKIMERAENTLAWVRRQKRAP